MSTDSPEEEAARWVARLRAEDFSEAEGRAFRRWLLADPRHEREFRAHQAVSIMIGKVLAGNPVWARSASSKVSQTAFAPAPRSTARASVNRRWAIGLAAAAALVMAILAGRMFVQPAAGPQEMYATGIGEIRRVVLAEGSSVHLNTRTRLKWSGDAQDRRVDLIEGEAYFEVKSDPARPFRVRVDGGEIQVLGTRFDIYRKADGQVVVSVMDGMVNVRPLSAAKSSALPQQELRANQQVAFNSNGWTRPVRTVNARNVVLWREGVLKLNDAPLSEVVEELKRYTSRPIFIADPRLASIGIGGAFSIHNTRSALDFVAEAVPMTVQETRDAFVLNIDAKRFARTGEQ